MRDFQKKYSEFLPWFRSYYINLELPEKPRSFYDPIRYHLQGKGKALRPAILSEVAASLGTPREDSLPAALAIELLHNFTLIHDDIMDGDTQRHGLETIHSKWNSNTAILAGDGLFSLAYRELEKLADPWYRPVSSIFHQKILAVCEGQSHDMDFEKKQDVSTAEYFNMVQLKTAELLSAAMEAGAVIGNADPTIQAANSKFGLKLGIVFQIQDDLLELTSSEDDMGKSLDSDIRAGKKTYPLIFAKEKAEKSNNLKFLALLNKKSYNNNEIKQLKENFADSDMIKLIEEKIHQDVIKLQHIADGLPDENKSLLLNFSQYILDRKK